MNLVAFNTLPEETAKKELFACCGSEKWTLAMMSHFPFASEKQLVDLSSKIWYDNCTEADWRESFTHHPKIGDVKSLTEKFAGKEQAGVAVATQETIQHLAKANNDYENKNGFIFIVCATGKSATEMLALLNDRLQNTAEEELHIAMGEQQKISIIRFKKMLPDGDFSFLKVSQITTHVLDTSTGIPGKDISIRLQAFRNNIWQTIAQGITNGDGRIPDLLPQERNLKPDTYKMVFDTGNYYANTKTFYPKVEIIFNTFDETHYHVPLLVNPFGYSTYRGS
ncbi:2-oxo-4-hydroxy-4-carboxy-5-ureidoimidazoline decarboxylase [Flavobacterium paronense]|uniref:2-oxo-4-hydroxy-4-carboxy-5-ureidoimidazoline decarboxylase n=1 Tax=Flavobacterium paronense TaxID=1392775 RepID=A0ABV5GAX0_9FLAO|nr:2-oxo-4-hydroxy-4-carboxy-5-ureidoimidazoline decarboxylase [Flavobacterium paronense]MDN3676770.1 2-oxo-4-hydroxy-4-carboxy-5-ureidoimidazoline decarboxylase [Flavobacterium paronense]